MAASHSSSFCHDATPHFDSVPLRICEDNWLDRDRLDETRLYRRGSCRSLGRGSVVFVFLLLAVCACVAAKLRVSPLLARPQDQVSLHSRRHHGSGGKAPKLEGSCQRPRPEDPCYQSVQWLIDMMQEHQVASHSRRHRGSSNMSLETAQSILFEHGLGGCRYRPCTSAEDLHKYQVNQSSDCDSALWPSECYERIKWVLHDGITYHQDWYPTLGKLSTHEEVQRELVSLGRKSCGLPCPAVLDPSEQLLKLSSDDYDDRPVDDDDGKKAHDDGNRLKPRGNVCAPSAPIQHLSSPVLESSTEDNAVCFRVLASQSVVTGSYDAHRNWCWVGIKHFGCHIHWPDRLRWQQMAADATKKGQFSSLPSLSPLGNANVCDQQVLGGIVDWSPDQLKQARAWFDEHVAIYVLSLPASTDRRARVNECMKEAFLEFEFVDGIDMRQPDALQRARQEGLIPDSFDFQQAQAEAYKQGMGTFGSIVGTVGCASGHFRAQLQGRKALPVRPLSLIFEDDVCPSHDLIPRLWRLVTQELPCDWQALSLHSKCPFGHCVSPHLTRVLPDTNEPKSRCYHGVNYGFYGMLYRMDEIQAVQKAMKRVVFDETNPLCLDVDVALAAVSDEVRYYAVPSVQDPGFLRELDEGSARVTINFQSR
eukprot:TRINITY_DN46218_c0_g1_i1.p1 TRINITY_DN46218_c0_g1~~TRINITY_DN46218_c0_g1_i1.p1  ORF type:complete len:649 (+),score=99.34 TRINITY_DN46218_c0_g1_i1:23-1969(+)